jgi:predicted methyltransferase
MKSKLLLTAVVAAALSAGAVMAKPAANITAAVADKGRPAADTALDAARKPAETLEFVGVKPGMTVVELIPGGGYFTRLFSKAVGPKGTVYAVYPPPRPSSDPAKPAPTPAIEKLAAEPAYSNVKPIKTSPTSLSVPSPADIVFTAQNYHDLHNIPNFDMAAFNKNVFNVLKPGGEYIVLDHVALPGDPNVTHTLHRIDPAVVRKEVEAAGFKFQGESKILANPADPHDKNVFDPSIRHHTDQFIYKFRKP